MGTTTILCPSLCSGVSLGLSVPTKTNTHAVKTVHRPAVQHDALFNMSGPCLMLCNTDLLRPLTCCATFWPMFASVSLPADAGTPGRDSMPAQPTEEPVPFPFEFGHRISCPGAHHQSYTSTSFSSRSQGRRAPKHRQSSPSPKPSFGRTSIDASYSSFTNAQVAASCRTNSTLVHGSPRLEMLLRLHHQHHLPPPLRLHKQHHSQQHLCQHHPSPQLLNRHHDASIPPRSASLDSLDRLKHDHASRAPSGVDSTLMGIFTPWAPVHKGASAPAGMLWSSSTNSLLGRSKSAHISSLPCAGASKAQGGEAWGAAGSSWHEQQALHQQQQDRSLQASSVPREPCAASQPISALPTPF
eukprot:scaffold65337_cov17-Tisochrysis_lutea.AAC.1